VLEEEEEEEEVELGVFRGRKLDDESVKRRGGGASSASEFDCEPQVYVDTKIFFHFLILGCTKSWCTRCDAPTAHFHKFGCRLPRGSFYLVVFHVSCLLLLLLHFFSLSFLVLPKYVAPSKGRKKNHYFVQL